MASAAVAGGGESEVAGASDWGCASGSAPYGMAPPDDAAPADSAAAAPSDDGGDAGDASRQSR